MIQSLFALLCVLPLQQDAEPATETNAEYVVHEAIPYAMVGDRELLLDALIPTAAGPHPAVLVIHGGAWRGGDRKQLRGYAKRLASMGFSCFCIDYRLAPEHKFPAQIDDCRTALQWVRQHADQYRVDPTRIGAIGYSAGGHLVALLATSGEAPSADNGQIDSRIQAGAAGGAPTDFRQFDDNGAWAEYWMGGDLDEVPEKFQQASPVVFVDPSDPPLFFFNGTADETVAVSWTEPCYEALRQAGVRTEMHLVEDAGHIFAAINPGAVERACEFLKDVLLDPSPAK